MVSAGGGRRYILDGVPLFYFNFEINVTLQHCVFLISVVVK
jgi:hypothetical protein